MQKFLILAAALGLAACGAAAQGSNAGANTSTAAPAEHQNMLATADTDHDGKVSRAEFIAARDVRFTQSDANHDGALSADERPHWGQRADQNGGANPQNASAPPRGNRGDSDGDGLISKAEYDAQAGRQFDRLDADHDGFLSQAEMQAMRDRRHQGQEQN